MDDEKIFLELYPDCIGFETDLSKMAFRYFKEGLRYREENPLESTSVDGKEIPVKEILAYLSEAKRNMTGNAGIRGYRETPTVKRLISARVREGASIDDFKLVIDHKKDSWKGTDFAQYLRPSTLFSATHFPEYLCEAEAVKKKVFSEMDEAIERMI